MCSSMWGIVCALILANILHAPFTGAEVFEVRLQGGEGRCSGRVEVWHNSRWGSVCGSFGWGLAEAQAVCRQLGCPGAVSAPDSACFGLGRGPAWLAYVRCHGSERFLHQCTHAELGPSTCGQRNNVGVVCDDYRALSVPSLRLVWPEGVVRVGDTMKMECHVPQRRCCTYYVRMHRNGGQIGYRFLQSEEGKATFTFHDAQRWDEGHYRCQYNYRDIQHTSPSSNTVTIRVDHVPVWVVPVSAAVGGLLLLILLLVTVHYLMKKYRSRS